MAEIEENGVICPSELGLHTQKTLHSLGGMVCDTVSTQLGFQAIAPSAPCRTGLQNEVVKRMSVHRIESTMLDFMCCSRTISKFRFVE